MKKFFAIIMTIIMTASLMTSLLCFTASAAGPIVMTVSGQQKSGGLVTIYNYDDFEEGWDAAMEYADDEDFMDDNAYDRIVIDFRADWNANEDGEFGASRLLGFQYSTIYVPDDARITINLNGNTINRGLTEWEYDGEVMYIDDDADVIINNGTIKGGNSCNGAGGIHVKDDARLELNDVHIVDNISDDDDGGGIALYDGAHLVMNGGSFENNKIDGYGGALTSYGGAVYVNDSKAFFFGVSFKNNKATNSSDFGAAIYADDSEVYIENCTFDGNGKKDPSTGNAAASIIHGEDSSIIIKGSTFTNNGAVHSVLKGDYSGGADMHYPSSIITLEDSTLTVEKNCTFSNNSTICLIYTYAASSIYVSDSTFKDNASIVIYSNLHNEGSSFRNCTFSNNHLPSSVRIFEDSRARCAFEVGEKTLAFYDCDMGDSTYNDSKYIKIVDSDAPNGAGSIFGEGSMPMLLAIIAIVVSIGSVCTTVILFKKKAVPAKAGKATETVDEE